MSLRTLFVHGKLKADFTCENPKCKMVNEDNTNISTQGHMDGCCSECEYCVAIVYVVCAYCNKQHELSW